GTAVLTDAMAFGQNERGHRVGKASPGVLLRRLVCTEGEIDALLDYTPRPEYALIHPILIRVAGGGAARGGGDRLLLTTPNDLDVNGPGVAGRFRPGAGEAAVFRLSHGQIANQPLVPWSAEEINGRLDDTIEGWRSWSAIHQSYEGPW